MKKTMAVTCFLMVFLFVCTVQSIAGDSNREPFQVNILSTAFGTGTYTLSSAMEDISKKSNHPWLRITSSESPGFIFNGKKLNQQSELKKDTIVAFSANTNWLAKNGKKPFKKKHPEVMLISNYCIASTWLATFDSDIKSSGDVADKKIGVGRATQITWAKIPVWLIEEGWGLVGKTKIEYLGTKPAASSLLDGLSDLCVVGGYASPDGRFAPSPQTTELIASGKTLYHLPWGRDAVETLNKKGYPLTQTQIKAGSMPSVEKDLDVYGDAFSWCAYPEFPEDVAYEVTKFIIENVTKFAEYHDLGKLMTADLLAYGWVPEKIHPGALRAYKESGLVK